MSEASTQTVVVVGHGMVAHRVCQRLIRGDADRRFRIVVLGDEPHIAYDRVHLTDALFGETATSLQLGSAEWYRSSGIELRLGTEVAAIDAETQRVETQAGEFMDYDHLILATGGRPFMPPIEGLVGEKTFVYRTVADLDRIGEAARTAKRAIVLGGGLIGLEAARAMERLGVAPTVLEAGPRLMVRQIGDEAGEVLAERMQATGVEVCLEARAVKLERRDGHLHMHLSSGDVVEGDLVIVATGTRPADSLAESAGIELGPRGGFQIDAGMQTSVPGIYAVGDCASFENVCLGFVAPGYDMADILAARLLGDDAARYTPDIPACDLKGAGVEVASVGDYREATQTIVHRDPQGVRVLGLHEGRVVCLNAVGGWDQLQLATEAIRIGKPLTLREIQRFEKTGTLPSSLRLPVAAWPEERVVCNCVRVSRGELTAAREAGACSAVQLTKATGAGSLCGSCEPLLLELCGGEASTSPRSARRRRWVLGSAVASAVLVAVSLGLGPVPVASTVQSAMHDVEALWRVGWVKQLTGYILLGFCVLATLISARRRLSWFNVGDYGLHRAVHTTLGLLGLLAVLVHTGMRLGHNLNFALMALFLGLIVLGSATGIIAHLEAGNDKLATSARRWRPWVAHAHMLATWPMVLLLGFHIFKAYYY